MDPLNTNGGLASLFWSLLFGLGEVELSLLISLVAFTKFTIVMAAKEALCHCRASVDLFETSSSIPSSLEIVSLFDMMR